ncbi:hypothetical protein V8V91_08585 [Algoriphagus halophilus]|uniref:hypothetical protein n=1 Tax=Algoriphagus halophilus TaxID=226505 RepID=UPI00358FB861
MSKHIFAIKKDGKESYLKITREKIHIPPYGILTPDELINHPTALTSLLKNGPAKKVFKEVSEKEYQAAVAEENEAKAQAEADAKAEQDAKDLAAYEAAKQVVAEYEAAHPKKGDSPKLEELQKQYEELTGNKPGNKKAETLLKEIEKFKSEK